MTSRTYNFSFPTRPAGCCVVESAALHHLVDSELLVGVGVGVGVGAEREQREQQLIMGGGGSSPAGSVRNSFGPGKTPTRTKATPQRARDRVVQSPENEASSVQVTGASPKRRPKAPAPVPISVALVPKPQAVGVARPSPGEASSLAQVQAMCGSLRLADKKKLLAWLGGRIEVEELQDLLGDRGGGITGAGEIPHVVHEHEL